MSTILKLFKCCFTKGYTDKGILTTSSGGFVTQNIECQRFQINKNSDLVLERGNLANWTGDAIVNAANSTLLSGGGGVDAAIHQRAGPLLLEACKELQDINGVRCEPGKAIMTLGFNLSVKNIIHTVGPIYVSEKESGPILANAYKSCLAIANENKFTSIAFPAISCGAYKYPKRAAAKIAFKTVAENVGNLEEVYFVILEKSVMSTYVSVAESMFNKIDIED